MSNPPAAALLQRLSNVSCTGKSLQIVKILISTFGTRGDIQPFVALGQGLQAAGYEIALCTPEGFKSLVAASGLDYAFVDNEFLALTEQSLQAQDMRSRLAVAKQFPAAIRRMLDDEWRAAQAFAPDAIIYHTKSLGVIRRVIMYQS